MGACRDDRPRNRRKPRIAGRRGAPARGKREKMTIARKLWLGFGVLILIFLLAGLIIFLSQRSTRSTLDEIANVEEPTRAATYEMEINTVEIGRDVRVYMINGDPRYREEFADDQADFEEFNTRYDELADTRKGKELGDRIDALYGQYVSLGETLLDKKDEQGTVSAGDQEEFLRRQNELSSLLSEEVQPWATQQLAEAENEASAAIQNVYVAIIALTLAGLLAGILAATLIYRSIIGSVHALTEGANRIGRGEIDDRIESDTSDELGTVAAAFNGMLDRRREANEALRESEERFRRLSDATFEGIVTSENGSRVRWRLRRSLLRPGVARATRRGVQPRPSGSRSRDGCELIRRPLIPAISRYPSASSFSSMSEVSGKLAATVSFEIDSTK
jgi:CHASE3 domain sensor protein